MALSLQDPMVQRRRLTNKLGVKLGQSEGFTARLHPSIEATGVLRVTLGWVFKASTAVEHIHQEVFCALLKLLTPPTVRDWEGGPLVSPVSGSRAKGWRKRDVAKTGAEIIEVTEKGMRLRGCICFRNVRMFYSIPAAPAEYHRLVFLSWFWMLEV